MLNLKQGNIIVGKHSGNKRLVLGVVGDAVLTSRRNEFEIGNPGIFTNKELTKLGYVIDDGKTKISLSDLKTMAAMHFGVDPEDIEIV